MYLTDMACRNAKPRPKPYKISDGAGMYLEVHPNGRRYWRLKYHYQGKEKRIALGVYPETSLNDARNKRTELRKEIDKGNDPSILKQEEKRLQQYNAAQTFEAIAREWHTRNLDTWTKGYGEDVIRRFEAFVFPVIGAYPISSLTTAIILNCIQQIESQKKHETARRVKQTIGQVFCYAVITDRTERDLTKDLNGALKRYKRSHYASIETDELPELLKAINGHNARLYKQTILAIRFLLLTFVRTNELIQAEWSEFNLDTREWHIPAERMKMRNPHIVPLANQAVEILNELKELNGHRKHLFPSIPRPTKPISNCTILSALKRMGYKGKMTGHGFRALAMTTIKERLGYRHEVVDRQLAHAPKNSVDRAYDRAKFLSERKVMMQHWADYIDRIQLPKNLTQTERTTNTYTMTIQNTAQVQPTSSNQIRSNYYGAIQYSTGTPTAFTTT